MSFEDDDVDFSGSADGLSALQFGVSRPPSASLTSMTMRQQQQQQSSSSSQAQNQAASLLAQAKPLVAVVVDAYKFVGDQYQPQGKVGFSLLGVAASRQYFVIMYRQGARGEKMPLTMSMVGEHFKFIVRSDNYGSFYDDSGCNWAARFDSSDALAQFCLQIVVAQVISNPNQNSVIQDVLLGNGEKRQTIGDGWKVECNYTFYSLNSSGESPPLIGQTVSKHRLKVSTGKAGLCQIVIGANCSGGRRIGAIRHNDGNFTIYDATVLRGKGPSENTHNRATTHETAGDTENPPVPNIGRSGLINRIARLGQSVFPGTDSHIESEVDFSDAESVSVVGTTNTSHSPPQARPKTAEGIVRNQSAPTSAGVTMMVGQSGVPIPTLGVQNAVIPKQQLAVYQSPVIHHQIQHPEVTTLTPAESVNKPEWSVLFMETRQNNTETRVSLSKIQDKLDALTQKLDHQQQQQSLSTSTEVAGGILDGKSVMLALQRMVTEEERLRGELKARQDKIEQLNERVSQLISEKQSLIEQSNRVLSEKSDALSTSANQTAGRVLQLEEEKANLAIRVSSLTAEVGDLHLAVADKRRTELELRNELAGLKDTFEGSNKRVQESNEAVRKMERDVEQVKSAERIASGDLKEEKQRRIALEEELNLTKSKLEATRSSLDEKRSSIAEVMTKATDDQVENSARVSSMGKEIKDLNDKLLSLNESNDQLSEQLQKRLEEIQEISKDRSRLYAEVTEKSSEITDLQLKVSDFQNFRKDWENSRLQYESTISELQSKLKYTSSIVSSSPTKEDIEASVSKSVKSIMNQVYQMSRTVFANDGEYYGSDVLKSLLGVIKQTTLSFLGGSSEVPALPPAKTIKRPVETVVVPLNNIQQESVRPASRSSPESGDDSHLIRNVETTSQIVRNNASESSSPPVDDEKVGADPLSAKQEDHANESTEEIPNDHEAQEEESIIVPIRQNLVVPADSIGQKMSDSEEEEDQDENGDDKEPIVVPIHRDLPVPYDSEGQPMSESEEGEEYASASCENVPSESNMECEIEENITTDDDSGERPGISPTYSEDQKFSDNSDEKVDYSSAVNGSNAQQVDDIKNGEIPSEDKIEVNVKAVEGVVSGSPKADVNENIGSEGHSATDASKNEATETLTATYLPVEESSSNKQPELTHVDIDKTANVEIDSKGKKSLFGDESDSDVEDLFGAHPPPTPTAKPAATETVVTEQLTKPEEDSDSNSQSSQQPLPPPIPKTSGGALFDDDDDDEDWFSS